ncbi:four helix bundle protein [Clostridium guangxiense]|uniref:four helix bundle protein n=1 Tax=Clostridium guangxiense TaxID=1662055 RepID=UPI001E5F10AE|nr:four helix bundle protein [Clostridium guangxiense]MCD2346270.1 four helix bundle protein [Clostridium guangxiense]
MSENVIEKKSFDFAITTIKLCKHIICENKEYVISNQLLRSGTSIGANVKEGLRGQSKRDFLAKMNIALKEANETEYWIELLIATGYIKDSYSEVLSKCKEICKILNSIVTTTKNTL